MHSLVGNIIRGVLNSIANQVRPEDYELSFCLIDKNNVVIYQETKTLEEYRQEDVDWVIDEIKNFANEDEKEPSKIKRTYYDTKPDALEARNPGWQRIYYDAAERKYYITDILKRPFWRL